MKKKKIEPLDIQLINDEELEERYEKARNKYISEFTEYIPGGLFQSGYEKHNPAAAEAKWDTDYPKGIVSWIKSNSPMLTGCGQQLVINKLNEVIKILNK